MTLDKTSLAFSLIAIAALGGCSAPTDAAASDATPDDGASASTALALDTDDGAPNTYAYIPSPNIPYTAIGVPVGVSGYGSSGGGQFVEEIRSTFHRSFDFTVSWGDTPRTAATCGTSHVYADMWGWRDGFYNPLTRRFVPGGWDLLQAPTRHDGVYFAAYDYCLLRIDLPSQTNTRYSSYRVGAFANDLVGNRKVKLTLTGR